MNKAKIKDIARGLKHHVKYKILSSKKRKPVVINMMANDICNSKCTMCNIWKQKLDVDITPDQLFEVLKNPLFSEVKHIGITGGEPTMREDLPLLYDAACRALPQLKGMSCITNGIKKDDVISRIEKSYKACKEHGVNFGFMVSLDGYKDVHDKQRGREGNFDSSIEVIKHFAGQPIDLAIGCTITKGNVWGTDDLLYFLKRENIYGRFRIAEHINRLYNNEMEDNIRVFDDDEIYHLLLFYEKLKVEFERNQAYKRTYSNIQQMLQGGKRMMGCPYQQTGLVLDSRGDLLYCAPKSKEIGNTIESDAEEIFDDNFSERKRILEENCEDCIHDYHAPATIKEIKQIVKKALIEKLFTIKAYNAFSSFLPFLFRKRKSNPSQKTIFITGWYGTETVGDKAILGGIVDFYIEKYGNPKFEISAIYPFIVERTIKELEIKNATMIPLYSMSFFKHLTMADEIVLGGGPIMQMQSLSIPLWAFKFGKKFRKKNIVFGCGIGPLYSNQFINLTKKLLSAADEVFLRDSKSLEFATNLDSSLGGKSKVIADPAHDYVLKIGKKIDVKQKDTIACFLRDWPFAYRGERSDEVFMKEKEQYNKNLANLIHDLSDRLNVIPSFYSMHNFVVGGDDRDFYRDFLEKYYPWDHFFDKGLSTVNTTIEAMKSSKYNFVMRYHSVLFAETLETNYLALDYTNGGKIAGFMGDRDLLQRMISLEDIINDEIEVDFLVNILSLKKEEI